MTDYSSNGIVDIILVLDEADIIIIKQRDCNRYRPKAVQIKRILLRIQESVEEIARINAKQDFDNPHVLAMFAILNLNSYISTKEMQ